MVGKLLAPIGMPVGEREQQIYRFRSYPLAGELEFAFNPVSQLFVRQPAELHSPAEVVEGTMAVGEERVHKRSLAPHEDKRHVRRSLERGPHQRVRVTRYVEYLPEFVEDHKETL